MRLGVYGAFYGAAHPWKGPRQGAQSGGDGDKRGYGLTRLTPERPLLGERAIRAPAMLPCFLHDPIPDGHDHQRGNDSAACQPQPVADAHLLCQSVSDYRIDVAAAEGLPRGHDHEPETMSELPASLSPGAPSERVARRTLAQRRRRVLASALTVILITLVMLLLTILNRDEQAVRACRERMEQALVTFQQHHEEWLRDPLKFPLPSVEAQLGDVWREHVLDNWRYTEQAAAADDVGVCCCERPHSRLFRPSGRHVIVFNVPGQKYGLRWMDEDDFVRRADELGFRLPVRP